MPEMNGNAPANVEPVNPAPAVPRHVTGVQQTLPLNQFDATPEERFQQQQKEQDRRDPWLDQSKVLLRDPKTGALTQHEKIPPSEEFGDPTVGRRLDTDPDAARSTGEAETDAAEQRYKIGDLELSAREWQDLAAHKAESDLRKAQVPASANEYKLELPKDLKLPTAFALAKENDPRFGPGIAAAREWAHKNQLSQGQFSDLLAIYATTVSHSELMIQNAARAEQEKMGISGPARIDAISMFLRGRYGDTAAMPMIWTLKTASQVEIWENIITKLQGATGFNAGGRIAPEPASPTDAQWNAMSYTQQKAYAEAATARAERGGRR
jgi:hypothetical protein